MDDLSLYGLEDFREIRTDCNDTKYEEISTTLTHITLNTLEESVDEDNFDPPLKKIKKEDFDEKHNPDTLGSFVVHYNNSDSDSNEDGKPFATVYSKVNSTTEEKGSLERFESTVRLPVARLPNNYIQGIIKYDTSYPLYGEEPEIPDEVEYYYNKNKLTTKYWAVDKERCARATGKHVYHKGWNCYSVKTLSERTLLINQIVGHVAFSDVTTYYSTYGDKVTIRETAPGSYSWIRQCKYFVQAYTRTGYWSKFAGTDGVRSRKISHYQLNTYEDNDQTVHAILPVAYIERNSEVERARYKFYRYRPYIVDPPRPFSQNCWRPKLKSDEIWGEARRFVVPLPSWRTKQRKEYSSDDWLERRQWIFAELKETWLQEDQYVTSTKVNV